MRAPTVVEVTSVSALSALSVGGGYTITVFTKNSDEPVDNTNTTTTVRKGDLDKQTIVNDRKFNNQFLKQITYAVFKMPEKVETFKSSGENLNGKYLNKLLSLIKKEHLDYIVKTDKKNEDWWKWAFQDLYIGQKNTVGIDETFKDITFGYSNSANDKALNQACEKAYSKGKEGYSFKDNEYLLESIGVFCTKGKGSRDVTKPIVKTYEKTEADGDEYKNGVLSKEGNKIKLVKDDTNNELWWKWAYRYKYKLNLKESEVDPLFENLKDGYGTDTKEDKHLNNACAEAYKKTQKDLAAKTITLFKNIQDFCTSDIKNTSLEFPDWNEPSTKETIKDIKKYPTGVGSIATNSANLIEPEEQKNIEWWNWSYVTRFLKEQEIDKLPDPFNSVKYGYSDAKDKEALNEACRIAYQKPLSELNEGEGDKPLKKVIKKFCSPESSKADLTLPTT